MTFEEMQKQAEALGFARVYTRFPSYAPRREVHRLNQGVRDDPREIFPETRTVILLVRPYRPFREAAEGGEGAQISAYYIESQTAYRNALCLADWLRAQGFQAFPNAQIAIKPLLERSGIGRMGRNSLLAIPGLGSRFHVQVILTDAEFGEHGGEEAGSDPCEKCNACVVACPTGAILPGGKIDVNTCLRARGEGEVVPEEMRHLYENRLLGCEICQNVCPRNRENEAFEMSEDLNQSLTLKNLLRGEMGCLPELIGKNYARKTRIRMKAALVAGNLKREDLKDELRLIALNGEEKEKEYAVWALKRMEEEGK